MSEKDKDSAKEPEEQAGEEASETEATGETAETVVPSEPEPQPESEAQVAPVAAADPQSDTPPAAAAAAAAPSRGVSGFIAWLALLLALALAGAAYWGYTQMLLLQARDAGLEESLGTLRQQAGQRDDQARRVDQLENQLAQKIREAETTLAGAASEREAELNEKLDRFEALLNQQRAELARYGANDRKEWLLAEAEYLLRLANQRLVMAGDILSAQALLKSADDILVELDDVSLYDARAAVAADLAALRAVPKVDVQGIYLRLSALIEQADGLVIFQLPELEAGEALPDADTWQARLEQGYEEALAKLSDYVIIRRRDVPMQALMDPQWEGLVRQNLRMLLEQAQVALLSGNQNLYIQSLERAGLWVREFFESDGAAAEAMAREINSLQAVPVDIAVPNLARSLAELDKAILLRTQRGGEE